MVLVASEKREEVTYAKFRERLGKDFVVRQAPRRHMDKAYDHENSEVLLCKPHRSGSNSGGGGDEEGGGIDNNNRMPVLPEARLKGETGQGTSSESRNEKARITNNGASPSSSSCAKSQRVSKVPQPPREAQVKVAAEYPSATATAAAAVHELSSSTVSLGSSSASGNLVGCLKDADGHAEGR